MTGLTDRSSFAAPYVTFKGRAEGRGPFEDPVGEHADDVRASRCDRARWAAEDRAFYRALRVLIGWGWK